MSEPNPVTRVVGAPPPVGSAPPAAARPVAGASLLQNKTALYVGGAVVVAAIAAFSALRGGGSGGGDDGSAEPFTLDTTATDLYGDLQPELEQIGDKLDQIIGPRPPVVTPPTTKPPTVPPPKPSKPGYSNHTVRAGEGLAQIAARYATTQGRVFASNAAGRTRLNGTKGTLRYYSDVKPGVVLVIPNAIKGDQS